MKSSFCRDPKKIISIFYPIAIAIILLAGIISGCQINNGIPITRPDLMPVCPADPVNYCDADIENQFLFVHIKNKSLADAEASHIQVVFDRESGEDQSQIKPVLPISAGETYTTSFDMTLGSWNPDCNFTITVDVYDEINESNERNNRVNGICSGKSCQKKPSLR